MIAEKLGSLLVAARQIAEDAGQEIRAALQSGFEVFEKADASPVTTLDFVAHRVITQGLQNLGEPWPILSEESEEPVPWSQRRRWQTYWLVDPLDGTRELLRQSPEFTVNIALIHQHRPILGVITAPALDLLYYARQGGGAWGVDPSGVARALHCRAYPTQSLPKVAASRRYAGPQIQGLLANLGPNQEFRIGSSLKSCRVAEGSLDVYPRYGPTSEWDTAAAQCIVEEAGGAILDWNLRPLSYNRKSSLINPSFLVVGDGAHGWAAVLQGLSGRGV